MPDELKDQSEQKITIPSVDDASGKKEIDTTGKSLLAIVNESLTGLVAKMKELEQRIAALEKG